MYNELCSALEKKAVMTHATTWANLEDSMPSAVKETQTDKYIIPPYEVPSMVKFIEAASGIVVTRGWGEGRGRLC